MRLIVCRKRRFLKELRGKEQLGTTGLEVVDLKLLTAAKDERGHLILETIDKTFSWDVSPWVYITCWHLLESYSTFGHGVKKRTEIVVTKPDWRHNKCSHEGKGEGMNDRQNDVGTQPVSSQDPDAFSLQHQFKLFSGHARTLLR